MKQLDLVKINRCAPYVVKEDTQEGAYTFISDSGAESFQSALCPMIWFDPMSPMNLS